MTDHIGLHKNILLYFNCNKYKRLFARSSSVVSTPTLIRDNFTDTAVSVLDNYNNIIWIVQKNQIVKKSDNVKFFVIKNVINVLKTWNSPNTEIQPVKRTFDKIV